MNQPKLKPGQVSIHGRVYDTVARRVQMMRTEYPNWTLKTKLVDDNGDRVVMKATLLDEGFRVISTGYAEEERTQTGINATSALEVCETSAVGRCLALAFWQGGENEMDPQIGSANEVSHAIQQQQEKAYGKYMAKVHEHWDTIVVMKQFLAEQPPNIDAATEAYNELGHEDMTVLWKAPTKGGIFTTEERRLLKEGYQDE